MAKTLRDYILDALERERQKTPSQLQEDLADKYSGITPEDAVAIRDGLLAVMDARTAEEQRQRELEYRELHARLGKKYRKSGA